MPAIRNARKVRPSLLADSGVGSSQAASGRSSTRPKPLNSQKHVQLSSPDASEHVPLPSPAGPSHPVAGRPTIRERLLLEDLEYYRTLGCGAQGQVVAVRVRPESEKASSSFRSTAQLALKVINKRKIRKEEAKPPNRKCDPRRPRNERRILARLPWNPFINGMLDAFVDERNIYYLLELAPVGSLHRYIRRSRVIPLDDAKFYFANIVLALEFLHSQGVVHLDIKPGNILMGADGYLSLADFGLAAVIDEPVECWAGTPEYHAPEMIAGTRIPRERRVFIDWWAAGITLYEMVTGKVPFFGAESESKLLSKIMSGKIMWYKSAEWEPELQDLLRRMLAPDASQRYGVKMRQSAPGQVPINYELRTHPWLRDLKWVSIAQRREVAPHVPIPFPDLAEGYFRRKLPERWMMHGLEQGRVERHRVP